MINKDKEGRPPKIEKPPIPAEFLTESDRAKPQYAKEGKLRGLGFVNLTCNKCQTLIELYQRTPQSDRDYWLMTELFVMLHGGDVCDKAFDKGGT